jgi:hypothetical protein
MNDLISRKALLAEYDRVHIGIPGRARKLIENAPQVDAAELPIWATETAYKNGYEAGFKDGYDGGMDVGKRHALKWIPVSERLPGVPDGWAENPDRVLYMMKSTGTIYAGYYGENGTLRDNYFRTYNDGFEGVDADDVLCWMWQHDLPEPPKGE